MSQTVRYDYTEDIQTISRDQCKTELKYDTRELSTDATYTIKATHQVERLNSNLYKNTHLHSVFDFLKLIGE